MQSELFLLTPTEGDEAFFCPECALLEGLLVYYPDITKTLRVDHVPFARPRNEIVERLGEANQGAPVLVFPEGESPEGSETAPTGRSFISGSDGISAYFAGQGWAGRPAP